MFEYIRGHFIPAAAVIALVAGICAYEPFKQASKQHRVQVGTALVIAVLVIAAVVAIARRASASRTASAQRSRRGY